MISRCDNDKRLGGLEVKKMMVGHETPDRFILARNEIQDGDRMTAGRRRPNSSGAWFP